MGPLRVLIVVASTGIGVGPGRVRVLEVERRVGVFLIKSGGRHIPLVVDEGGRSGRGPCQDEDSLGDWVGESGTTTVQERDSGPVVTGTWGTRCTGGDLSGVREEPSPFGVWVQTKRARGDLSPVLFGDSRRSPTALDTGAVVSCLVGVEGTE